MAFRYLIYSTGTTYASTIVRESATDNPNTGERSYYTDFLIPEIQPLYLWRVDAIPTPTAVIPNIDSNIIAYENATAPPATSEDLVTYGELTGNTANKIDKVTGQTNQVPVFTAGGGLQSSNFTVAQITGKTTYTFMGGGGTIVTQTGNTVKISSTDPTGTTVSWGNVVGNINLQTDLQNQFNTKLNKSTFTGYTASTKSVIAGALTGVTAVGSGSTLISSTANRVVNLKSISTRGGVKLVTDGNNVIISGQTTAPTTWGMIGGTLSNQTDLWQTLTGMTATTATKLNTSTFQNYTGTTQTLINSKVAKVTGATTNDIVIFGVGGEVADSGIKTRTDVRNNATATNGFLSTELGVRTAIDAAVAAAVKLQGDWNAATNVPNLNLITGATTTGFAWRVAVSGTTNLGGINRWYVGDLAVKASGTTWIKIANQDIAAIWGNIGGTLANQTDLYQYLTGLTASIATKQNTITGAATTITSLDLTVDRALISNGSGKVAVGKTSSTELNYLTGATSNIQAQLNTKLPTSTYTAYTAATKIQIDSKLPIATFTGYTASTKNVNKKIQVIWTGVTTNANVVVPLGISWTSTPIPYSSDIYTWTGGTAIKVLSAGTYEVQYHVLLKNDNSNQTHSVGGYIVKNGATVPATASAGMVVGSNASGELSLPPVILTLGVNNVLQLAVFRIGSAGNANLVTGSVFLSLNKLS